MLAHVGLRREVQGQILWDRRKWPSHTAIREPKCLMSMALQRLLQKLDLLRFTKRLLLMLSAARRKWSHRLHLALRRPRKRRNRILRKEMPALTNIRSPARPTTPIRLMFHMKRNLPSMPRGHGRRKTRRFSTASLVRPSNGWRNASGHAKPTFSGDRTKPRKSSKA